MTTYLQETEWSFTDVAKVILVGFVAAVLVGALLLPLGVPLVVAFGISVGAQAVGSLGVMAAFSRSRGTGSMMRDYGVTLRLGDFWALFVGMGLQVAVVIVVLAPIAQIAFEGEPPTQEVAAIAQEATSLVGRILVFLTVVVLAPVYEEMIFRGMLLSRLLRSVGRNAAVLLSAAAFAGVHLLDPNAVLAVPGLFVIGIVLGYMALRRGNLSLAILTHAGVNLLAAILLVFGDEIADWLERTQEQLEQLGTLLGFLG